MTTFHRGRPVRAALVLAALLLVVPALVPTAPAAHGCRLSTSSAVVVIGPGVRYSLTLYVVLDVPTTGGLFIPLPWIYEESNAFDGLQRADEWKDDTCGGEYAPDMLIF